MNRLSRGVTSLALALVVPAVVLTFIHLQAEFTTDKTFTPAAEVARMIIGRARVVENSSKYGLKLASNREAGFQGPPEISGAPFRLGDPESTQPDSDRAAPLLVLRASRLIGAARAGGAMQQYAVQLKQMPVGDDAAETV